MTVPEKTTAVIAAEIAREGEAGLPRLTYRLLAGRKEGRPSFSIECEAAPAGILFADRALLKDVSSDPGTALRLLKALAQGYVTPYALAETAEELIGTGF